jgi:hypothetical protein
MIAPTITFFRRGSASHDNPAALAAGIRGASGQLQTEVPVDVY